MGRPLVVTHERLGTWAAQLRPRLDTASGVGAVQWVESRSTADLERAVCGSVAPIVLIDLGDRPRSMLEDLDRAVQAASLGLFLVLDAQNRREAARMARELGATRVISGRVLPPMVSAIVAGWLPLARRRDETGGWSLPIEPVPEFWERPRD